VLNHGGRRHDPGVRAQGRDPFGWSGVDHEADAPRRRRPCWSLAAVAAMVDDLIRQVHALDAVANSGLDLRRHKVPTGS
jgi:hypothetical protein